ncbi:MAG: hypothetical protein IH957_01480 [Chloroflexi bacterium]|nr:hypothetical protein [Chloroflexota bacterium]
MLKLTSFAAIAFLAATVVACNGADGEPNPAPTSIESPIPSPTGEPGATSPEPTELVQKPAASSLLPLGYVLDEVLDVSLDGSEVGQIVILSHTVRRVAETGDPSAAAVPRKEGCTDPSLDEMDPSACIFRAEVFGYEAVSGWSSRFITPELPDPEPEREKGVALGHRGGVQSPTDATSFKVEDGRDVLVLTFHYCTGIGSGCGSIYEVVTMPGDEVKSVYSAWKAQITFETSSVTFGNPVIFRHDGFCCPSGLQIDTLALDPATGELGVIESRLEVCAEGTLAHNPAELFPDNLLGLSCDSGRGVLFETTAETVVEPTGDVDSLRQGQNVRVEYNIKDCSPGGADCFGKTLTATKITLLNR